MAMKVCMLRLSLYVISDVKRFVTFLSPSASMLLSQTMRCLMRFHHEILCDRDFKSCDLESWCCEQKIPLSSYVIFELHHVHIFLIFPCGLVNMNTWL